MAIDAAEKSIATGGSSFPRGYERKARAMRQKADLTALNNYWCLPLEQIAEIETAYAKWLEVETNKDSVKDVPEFIAHCQHMTAKSKVWAKLQGKWSGTVSPELGGYPQQYNFVSHDKVEVTVLTNTMTADFRFVLTEEPYTMDIIIKHPEQHGQAQIAPYIFNFLPGDEQMEMCCPCGELERPKAFNKNHGGYVVMSKKELVEVPDEDKERIAAMSEDEKVIDYIQVTTSPDLTSLAAPRCIPPDTKLQFT